MDNDNYLGDKIEYYVHDNSDDKTGKKKAKKIRIIFHGTIGLYNYSLGVACFIQETFIFFWILSCLMFSKFNGSKLLRSMCLFVSNT